jgi:hypothetical protein
MTESPVRRGHVVPRLVIGLAYVAAGFLVLLVQVEDVVLRWSVVAPLAMLLLGLGLLVTALVDTHLHGQNEQS